MTEASDNFWADYAPDEPVVEVVCVRELEAENGRLRMNLALCEQNFDGMSSCAEKAEDELAERDAQRCQGCRLEEGCKVYMALTANFYEPWSCCHWEARAEGGIE